jgi:hypothetical protein
MARYDVGAFNSTFSSIYMRFVPPPSFEREEDRIQVTNISVSPNDQPITFPCSNFAAMVLKQHK